MDHGEVVNHAVPVAVIGLPGEIRVVDVNGFHDFIDQVAGQDIMVAAAAVIGAVPALGMRCLQPFGIDQALGDELSLGLLQVIIGHRVAAQVHRSQVRVMDDHAGLRANPKIQLGVQGRGGILIPDGVVVARTGGRDLIMERADSGHRCAAPIKAVGVGEFHRHGQAHDLRRGLIDRLKVHYPAAALALIVEQLLKLLGVGRGGIALGPFLPESLDRQGPGFRVDQEDALFLQNVQDLIIPGDPVVRCELAILEHAQRLDALDDVRVGGCLCKGRPHQRDHQHDRQAYNKEFIPHFDSPQEKKIWEHHLSRLTFLPVLGPNPSFPDFPLHMCRHVTKMNKFIAVFGQMGISDRVHLL